MSEPTACNPATPYTCLVCKAPFHRIPSRLRGGYCSRKCAGVAKRGKPILCVECGKADPNRSRNDSGRCRSCYGKSLRNGQSHPCRQCGKPVYKSSAELAYTARRRGVFCDRRCHGEYMRGANNPSFMGGRSRRGYPPGFRAARRVVIARERATCFLCLEPQAFVLKGGRLRSNLEVHHIDWNKANNALENLVLLCRPCHSRQRGTPEKTAACMARLSCLLAQRYGYTSGFITWKWMVTITTLRPVF